ncbi:S9 family peptidase [Biomphalaria pfeifferi]|uniref:S9 family peptidase n=1 Tax=Biomphalaria pfeifferi TaxID=112525 RepID=A0AAD8EUL4_BIOPF|nr:S9 family peptidase [Biomphalaria pfeifferi]
MKKTFLALLLLTAIVSLVKAQPNFNINELINVKRVGDPQLSPDGKKIAFTIGVVDKAANRTLTQIYTVSPDGSDLKQLTNAERSSSSPRWSPDHIAFTTGGQIWGDGRGRRR